MKWVRTLPRQPGAYVIGLTKSYRVEREWTALGSELESHVLYRAAHAILDDAGATFGEVWIQGESAPQMRGVWFPTPYALSVASPWFDFGYWVTCKKAGQARDILDPAAMMLFGPGVISSHAAIHHLSPNAAKALMHLPAIEEHAFQRGQSAKLAREMTGEAFWEAFASPGDYLSVHTFTVDDLAYRYFHVDSSWAHSLDVCLDGEWTQLVRHA